MHDGTKITAQAGPGSFKQEEQIRKHLTAAQEYVAAMEIPAVRTRHRGKPQPASGRDASAWSGSNKPSSTFSRSVPPNAPAMLVRARNRSA
jgi:hypothetical protein